MRAFSSSANFLFFSISKQVFHALEDHDVLIKDFSGKLEGYYRLTISTPKENNRYIKEKINKPYGASFFPAPGRY